MTGTTCPVCDTPGSDLFSLGEVPVFANELHPTPDSARDAPTAPMDLSWCTGCGHIWNRSFDPALLEYSVRYEAALDASPTFQQFRADLVDDLRARHGLGEGLLVDVGCGRGLFLRELSRRVEGLRV